jgi:hypothetical protein
MMGRGRQFNPAVASLALGTSDIGLFHVREPTTLPVGSIKTPPLWGFLPVIALSRRTISVTCSEVAARCFRALSGSCNHEPACFQIAPFHPVVLGFSRLLLLCVYFRKRHPVVALAFRSNRTWHGLARKEWRLDFRLATDKGCLIQSISSSVDLIGCTFWAVVGIRITSEMGCQIQTSREM